MKVFHLGSTQQVSKCHCNNVPWFEHAAPQIRRPGVATALSQWSGIDVRRTCINQLEKWFPCEGCEVHKLKFISIHPNSRPNRLLWVWNCTCSQVSCVFHPSTWRYFLFQDLYNNIRWCVNILLMLGDDGSCCQQQQVFLLVRKAHLWIIWRYSSFVSGVVVFKGLSFCLVCDVFKWSSKAGSLWRADLERGFSFRRGVFGGIVKF